MLFRLGLHPKPVGELSAPPGSLFGFNCPAKLEESEKKKREKRKRAGIRNIGKECKRDGRDKRGKEGGRGDHQFTFLVTPLPTV